MKQKKSSKTKPKENDSIINSPNSKRPSKIPKTKLLTLSKKWLKFNKIKKKEYTKKSKRKNKSYSKPKRRKGIKKDVSSVVPDNIYLVTAPPTRAEDSVTSVALQSIITVTVKSNLINLRTVFTVAKKGTLQENVRATKRACIEKEGHASDVDQFDTH